jgi:hypothetical protein
MWEFKQFKYIEVGNPGTPFIRREPKQSDELRLPLTAYIPHTGLGAEQRTLNVLMSMYTFSGLFFLGFEIRGI